MLYTSAGSEVPPEHKKSMSSISEEIVRCCVCTCAVIGPSVHVCKSFCSVGDCSCLPLLVSGLLHTAAASHWKHTKTLGWIKARWCVCTELQPHKRKRWCFLHLAHLYSCHSFGLIRNLWFVLKCQQQKVNTKWTLIATFFKLFLCRAEGFLNPCLYFLLVCSASLK